MQGSTDLKADRYGPSDLVPATPTSKSFEKRTCEIFENAKQNGPWTGEIKMYGPRFAGKYAKWVPLSDSRILSISYAT